MYDKLCRPSVTNLQQIPANLSILPPISGSSVKKGDKTDVAISVSWDGRRNSTVPTANLQRCNDPTKLEPVYPAGRKDMCKSV